jgi:hypothetical protein
MVTTGSGAEELQKASVDGSNQAAGVANGLAANENNLWSDLRIKLAQAIGQSAMGASVDPDERRF